MEFKEKKISGEIIFDGKVVKLEKDKVLCPNNQESFREIIRHNGGACVLAVTKDDCILLIKQFRYAYDEVMYELPAGKLEKDEDPMLAAQRELEEETGFKANKIDYLGVMYPTCGYSSEKIYMYYTDDMTKTNTSFDEDEVIELYKVKISDVLRMIKDGTIKDAKTINAVMLYLLKVNKIVI